MIPKIIHYCWLSSDPVPPQLRACIDSWHRVLPDYEIRLWDYKRFPRGKSKWVDEAFDSRKYAFAADYIRAYALFHEGGIYLDSDVEVLRSFNDLLSVPHLMCRECGSGLIEAAVMGAEAGHPLMGALLRHYDSHDFRRPDGTLETTGMPAVVGMMVDQLGLKLNYVDDTAHFSDSPDCLNVLPYDYFSPINIENMEMRRTARTYCIHHFAGSWTSPWRRFKKRMQVALGPTASQWVINAKRRAKRLLGVS